MSVHTIVTRGYASTDNYTIPTLGYSSATAAPETGTPIPTFHARPIDTTFHARPLDSTFHARGQ
jgi:hypothetical protein